tara:strand:- start:3072 stop:3821 length:750 start_codon:yes stop_codon:yes gene_type:complete
MKSTLDEIIADVLESMPMKLDIYAVQLAGSDFKCWTTNTFYLTDNSPLILNGVEYKVDSFSQDEYIILKGASSPFKGVYNIPNLKYVWGRFNQVNIETARKKSSNILPMLWRFDLESRTVNLDDNANASTGNTRLFFIQTSNFESYQTKTDYTKVLNPLEAYSTLFIKYLKKHRLVGKLSSATMIKHPKFLTSNGSVGKEENSNVFDRYVSAVELTISLPIRVDMSCKTRFIPVSEGRAFSQGFDEGYS